MGKISVKQMRDMAEQLDALSVNVDDVRDAAYMLYNLAEEREQASQAVGVDVLRDAARYRWLITNASTTALRNVTQQYIPYKLDSESEYLATIDTHIDAAMQSASGGEVES